MPSAGTTFDVHSRPRAEGEARRRKRPQSSTQQLVRPKEEDEDFNNSLVWIQIDLVHDLKICKSNKYLLYINNLIIDANNLI